MAVMINFLAMLTQVLDNPLPQFSVHGGGGQFSTHGGI
jgi:hypothetical protein